MTNSRTNEWLVLLAIVAFIWTIPLAPVYAICCAVALVLAVRWDAWYFALLGLYAACMVAVHLMPGPYDSYSSEDTLIVLKAGITIITITWLAVRSLPAKDSTQSAQPIIFIPERILRPVRWLCLLAGLTANVSRYSGGVPLFSGQVDVVRQLAREQSNIVTGFLSEGWTLGVMLVIASVLVARRRPRPSELAWLIVFLLGAFAGASRNSLLTAVIPGVLVGLHFRNSARGGIQERTRQEANPRLNRLGITMGVGVLFFGLMWFQSQRIMHGVGQFERAFQQQFAGSDVKATLASLDLSLSGSFETLSRLVAAGTGGSKTDFTVLQGLGAVPRWLGYHPDLYQVTSALSAPYYMNTATYLAAPIVDFGIVGGLAASFLLGLLFGGVDRRLERDRTIPGQLIRYYIVYMAIFSVYEFVPFIQPNWVPVIVSLILLRYYSKSSLESGPQPALIGRQHVATGASGRFLAKR